MRLLPGWKKIIWRAWSSRLIALAFVLTTLEVVVNFWQPPGIPPLTFGILAGLVTAAAFAARIVAQEDLHDRYNDEEDDLDGFTT